MGLWPVYETLWVRVMVTDKMAVIYAMRLAADEVSSCELGSNHAEDMSAREGQREDCHVTARAE